MNMPKDWKNVYHLSAYEQHEYRNKSVDDFTTEWSPVFLLVVSCLVSLAGGVFIASLFWGA